VPLLDKAKEILAQFGLDEGATYRGTVFKYVSNKVMNDHLKIIGLACGFDFELHPYIARHTFGTTVTPRFRITPTTTWRVYRLQNENGINTSLFFKTI
jgi:hypothetical protein